jgi:site-specific recombinase XerD
MNTEYKCWVFSQFSEWLSNQVCYSINTRKPYLRIIKSFLDYLENFNVNALKDVDKELLLKFIISRGDNNYAKAYVRLRESALDLFFAWANKYKYCQNNPIIDHRKAKLNVRPFPKKPTGAKAQTVTILTAEEQRRLLNIITGVSKASDAFTTVRDKCIIILILTTALYAEELIHLLVSDMDLENDHISILSRQNKERRVPINIQARLACNEWLTASAKILNRETQSTLFLTEHSNPITKRHLYRIVSNAMRNAGIDKNHLGPEVLRQTAIYEMFRNGLSLEEVQKATGITTLANLKKYLDYKPKGNNQ